MNAVTVEPVATAAAEETEPEYTDAGHWGEWRTGPDGSRRRRWVFTDPQHSNFRKPAVGEKSASEASEKYPGEKSGVGENSLPTVGEKPALAKNQKSLKSSGRDFSPTNFRQREKREFSPTKKRHENSPTRDFSPTKKAPLKLVKPTSSGKRGRPRNPELPPAPDKYFYWTKARNGLKLERRVPEYEYVGFIMPNEWQALRGIYGEDYILEIITAAIRVKRARSLARASDSQTFDRTQKQSG